MNCRTRKSARDTSVADEVLKLPLLPRFSFICTAKRGFRNYGIISTTYMCMLDEIRTKRDEIYAIARKHKAEKLWVFGSCARKEERPDSDVDFLVKWMPGEYSWRNERAMSSAYEKLLGSKVDLVASRILPQSLGFAHRVCKEAVPV